VGLVKVAVVGELGHDVADGGRTETILAAPGDDARSHGLTSLDVDLHERVQHFEGALGNAASESMGARDMFP